MFLALLLLVLQGFAAAILAELTYRLLDELFPGRPPATRRRGTRAR
jgi:hypothetical protein